MNEVRGGEYAFYKGEEIWVVNARPDENKALITFNPDMEDPNFPIRAEWVKYEDLVHSSNRR